VDTSARPDNRSLFTRIALCFLVSGSTGLIYEVVWIRLLGLVFGHTVFAITTVLAAFMAGLALGSFGAGHLIDRQPRPLRLYGALEIGVGLFCLAVPFALPVLEWIYLALATKLGLSLVTLTLAQFVVLFGVLLLPTTLMGATLPVLTRFFVQDEQSLGRRVGLLYALNTLGAVAGTALAGYLLLPTFGMRGTVFLAVTVNVGIGALCILYDRQLRVAVPAAAPAPVEGPVASARIPAIAIALAVSGAASMVYEVAWTRALTLVVGSSTYAFTGMLVAFLIGIAGGSALFSWLLGARRLGVGTFVVLQFGAALSATAVLPIFERLPGMLLRAMTVSVEPTFMLVIQVVLSVVAMLVPTLFIGATFPCAVKAVAHAVNRVGFDVGRLYAFNTLGAIAGTVVTGFVLIPLIGVQMTAKTAVMINVATGLALLLFAVPVTPVRRAAAAAAGLAIVGGAVAVPAWNPDVMSSGIAVYGHRMGYAASQRDLARALPASTLLSYEDGLSATVTVHRNRGTTFLRVNGKTDASTGLDMHTQLISGHLPMLMHPAPKNVLVIGFGSGVTVSAVARHAAEHIDIVEIEPAIIRAGTFFADVNRNVLQDPRVHLAVADGRNFLLTTPRRYDVIISEPSNPWIGGLASLFSEEFYALAKSRLKADGVMLQWVQGYGFHPSDLKMVVNTFRTSFPGTTIWHTHSVGDYLLLGRARATVIDVARLAARVDGTPGVRDDFARSGLTTAESLFADFILNEADATRFAGDGGVNDDDLLPLEFSAPRSLHLPTASLNFSILRSFRTAEFPLLGPSADVLDTVGARHAIGRAYVAKDLPAEAARHFEAALKADPRHVPSWIELGKAQKRLKLSMKAAVSFESALKLDAGAAEAHFQLADLYKREGLADLALATATRAATLDPQRPAYHVLVGSLLMEQGRLEEAETRLVGARAAAPRDPAVLDNLANVYMRLGRPADAVGVLREAVAMHPDDPELSHHLGKAYLAAKQYPAAITALNRAAENRGNIAGVHVDLGYAHLGQGNFVGAVIALERAISLDPTQAAASQTLSGLYRRLDGTR
jgi:spermidine synthase